MNIISEWATKTIEVIKTVFGEEMDGGAGKIPLCISVVSDEGFELFSTQNCGSDTESINVLGLVAFEELKQSLASRTKKEIDILIFRTENEECYVKPVSEHVFMIAVMPSKGFVGNVLPLLDGLGQQISYALEKTQQGGQS